jgi:DNA-binding XRE family transcriptional regulator
MIEPKKSSRARLLRRAKLGRLSHLDEVKLSVNELAEAREQAAKTKGARARPVDTADLLEGEKERAAYFDALSAANSGQFVRQARKRKGWTQAQLATVLGISQARISELESGSARQGPTVGLLARIADACGLKLALTLKP